MLNALEVNIELNKFGGWNSYFKVDSCSTILERNMKVAKVMLPAAMENCYLAINEETKESIIIDPGSAADRVKSAVSQTGTKPVAVLLTHGLPLQMNTGSRYTHMRLALTSLKILLSIYLQICMEAVKHTGQIFS